MDLRQVLRLSIFIVIFRRSANQSSEAIRRLTERYPSRIPGRCSIANRFDCGVVDSFGNRLCLSLASVRDCIDDCGNNADEECGVDEVFCDAHLTACGKCVNSSSAQQLCLDRKWEGLCGEPGVFECQSTDNCVLPEWLGDGENDCGDRSDEDPCLNGGLTCGATPSTTPSTVAITKEEFLRRIPGNCRMEPLEFECFSGECIGKEELRDCEAQCADGEDEACWIGQVRCESGCKCVEPDNAAEQCAPTKDCEAGQFGCVAGGCVANFKVHDGAVDCNDESDERYCSLYLANCDSNSPCVFLPQYSNFTCGCPEDYVADERRVCRPATEYPADCADVQMAELSATSGIYTAYRQTCEDPLNCAFPILCDLELSGGGWTVIQQRDGPDGASNFSRNWEDYRSGFGFVDGSLFWIGNEQLFELTNKANTSAHELMLQLTPSDGGETLFVHYTGFRVHSEQHSHSLGLGPMLAGDSDELRKSRGRPFGTRDRDTDALDSVTCGAWWHSGWWFDAQCDSVGNLNVPYRAVADADHLRGLVWADRRLRAVAMLTRPAGFRVEPRLATTPVFEQNAARSPVTAYHLAHLFSLLFLVNTNISPLLALL